MKSFQRFILLTFFSFIIKGVWILYFGKSFFERFTLDFYGFIAVMQFVLAAFAYVYIYEKTQFYKKIDYQDPTKFILTFTSCIILSFIVSLILGTIKMHFKIEINNYLKIFLPDVFYNFLFLSIALFIHKLTGSIPKFRLNNKPFFYLKLFFFEILYAVGFLLFIFALATSDSDKKMEVTTTQFLIDGILFAIILVNLAFFISYGINKIALFRKSIFFPMVITTILTFWIIKLIGYPQDYFRAFITENALKLITLIICNSIVASLNKESKRNFKINKLTSDFSKKEAEYLQLKQQVNPHFLFNNLNTLISFIEINPKKAIEFGHHLSNTYRHYLNNKNDDFVSLKEELEFIKEYLEIYKAKFENSFSFEISFVPKENEYIVCLSLQEIVDNVFKHNTMNENNPLELRISRVVNGLVIENTVSNKMDSESNQIGLENINKRYKILTNKEIQIVNQTDTYQVILPILELEN